MKKIIATLSLSITALLVVFVLQYNSGAKTTEEAMTIAGLSALEVLYEKKTEEGSILLYRVPGEEQISLAFLDKGVLSNKFFWSHHAPIILLIIFSSIVFVIGLKTKIQLRKDYNKTLSSMFTAYSETHPTVSDAEWTAHLEELDKELSEAKN